MTLQQAAQIALDCQNAVKEIIHEVIWPEARRLGKGTEYVNTHPIVTLFLSKLCSLNRDYFECDYLHASDAWEALVRGETVEYAHQQVQA